MKVWKACFIICLCFIISACSLQDDKTVTFNVAADYASFDLSLKDFHQLLKKEFKNYLNSTLAFSETKEKNVYETTLKDDLKVLVKTDDKNAKIYEV